METRLTVAADAALLAALHSESFGSAAWNANQIAQSLALPTARSWIAEESGVAQGFILCQFPDAEAEILTFCVTPAARRRGIAQALLTAAIAQARRENADKIFLEVAIDNIAAMGLYEKIGFVRSGARKNYYQRGRERIDALMLVFEL